MNSLFLFLCLWLGRVSIVKLLSEQYFSTDAMLRKMVPVNQYSYETVAVFDSIHFDCKSEQQRSGFLMKLDQLMGSKMYLMRLIRTSEWGSCIYALCCVVWCGAVWYGVRAQSNSKGLKSISAFPSNCMLRVRVVFVWAISQVLFSPKFRQEIIDVDESVIRLCYTPIAKMLTR